MNKKYEIYKFCWLCDAVIASKDDVYYTTHSAFGDIEICKECNECVDLEDDLYAYAVGGDYEK